MKTAIVIFPGTNRERDVAIALQQASGQAPAMLWHQATELPAGLDLAVLPGGFSHGDYLRCGAMAAQSPIMPALHEFAARGGHILGICNGFQILTEAGLLPGALLRNAGLRFISRDCHLRVERSDTAFTRHYAPGQVFRAPMAHGDGNYFASAETVAALESEGRVAFRYVDASGALASDANPNGSVGAIAGIYSENLRVMGLMPHPEDLVDPLMGGVDGRPLFAGMMEALGGMNARVDAALAKSFGLNAEEYDRVLSIMGRTPSLTELGIFSVMWSEHCSYKSSRVWLRELPTEAPWVIHGPGENAGVVDIGEGLAAIFKMESHNHPSFIEPYQGAATGVGGILRDVFTMGARPVANLNALRFGRPENPNTRRVVDGVVRGIGGYGNCVGVPTVGGEVNFHAAYDGNPLVNAMTVGIARQDRIFLSAAAGVGNPVVYVGSRTGRDGIHGATMASAEFGADAEAKRPTVQVGDPFTEKLLIEACLELMATDAIIAIQDMGAAGLTSSSVEMAGKGDVGIDLDLDACPQRETGMTAYEMMLSESQERMLMVLRPDRQEMARAIFAKWELDFAVIGHLTDTGHIVIRHQGRIEADIPLAPLADLAPSYRRPYTLPQPPAPLGDVADPVGIEAALMTLIACPDLCSRAWITDQYDSTIGGQTVRRPGAADAAVVRIEGSRRALALTTDCTPRYCAADPRMGGAQAVAEAWRNLTAVGARPLAVTDNLNFGNPEKPEIMGQFVAAVQGMGEACRALDFPIVSGNVSLYNETQGTGILPTPAIGGLGVLDDAAASVGLALTEGQTLVLIGHTEGHLGQSLWLREIAGREEGAPPPVDLAAERRNGDFVRAAIGRGGIGACHDLSDGGLLVALAEMAMAGPAGITLAAAPATPPPHAWWFGEDQARYVLATDNPAGLLREAAAAGIQATVLGGAGGDGLTLPGGVTISSQALHAAHDRFFAAWMKD